jgi:raffinose/stachyose/melibiose transport system substrate-binding protein
MKKNLVLLMAAILTVGIMSGCGSKGKKEQSVVIYQNKVEIGEQLTAFASEYTKETGVKITIKTSGGDSPYGETLKAEFQSDRQPDVFVIEGKGGYNTWKSKLAPFEGDEWIKNTDLAFKADGKVYGFPVAVEGWGMAYNVDLLAKAGVDPSTLTTQEGYKAAFEKIDSMKSELGITSAVAMSAGPDMTWVTGLHDFNSYLSSGLTYGDTTVLDKLLKAEVDKDRLTQYADWVEMLFKHADKSVLLTGNYDAQVGQFATGKSVFIHQGNWIDPWLTTNNVKFSMAFAPYAPGPGTYDSLFIGAPSFYVINKDSENQEAAKAFLNYMATNPKGAEYMVNQAKMVPAFKNITLKPTTPLSANLAEWVGKGKSYTWLQNDMPDGFGMGTLGPIYGSFAKGDLTKEQFIEQVTAKVSEIK